MAGVWRRLCDDSREFASAGATSFIRYEPPDGVPYLYSFGGLQAMVSEWNRRIVTPATEQLEELDKALFCRMSLASLKENLSCSTGGKQLSWEHVELPAGAQRPGLRDGHVGALVDQGRKLLVLCGDDVIRREGRAGVFYQKIYYFDFESWKWVFPPEYRVNQRFPPIDNPLYVTSPTHTYQPNRNAVFLFGGIALMDNGCSSDMYRFDVAGMRCERIRYTGAEPSTMKRMKGAMCTTEDERFLFLFGGYDSDVPAQEDSTAIRFRGDLHMFDVEQGLFRLIKTEVFKRSRCALLCQGGMLLLAGGMFPQNLRHNDVWALDPRTGTHHQLAADTDDIEVAPRRFSASAACPLPGGEGVLLVQGGTGNEVHNIPTAEVWFLSVRSPPLRFVAASVFSYRAEANTTTCSKDSAE